MKTRLWLGGIAAVLLLASCEGFFNDGTLVKEGIVEYTADGQRLVNLSVPTGGTGLSMTGTIAASGIDYYEVIFENGGNYYRGAGPKGSTIRLSVPEGKYDGTVVGKSAILLAGTYNQKTLLGTGVLTAVDGGAISTSIDATTRTVTFDVTALTAVVEKSASSAFAITQATMTTATNSNFYLSASPQFVYFKVPTDTPSTTATWQITGLAATGSKLEVATPVVTNTSMYELQSTWLTSGVTFDGLVAGDFLNAPTGGAGVGEIKIIINTSGLTTSGWSPIAFDIPVHAYAAAAGDLWHIKSGINYRLDTGGTPAPGGFGGGDGSGIMLCVGTEVPLTVITP